MLGRSPESGSETAMTITIDPKLETRLRERAEAEGLTVSAYVERLVSADQAGESVCNRGFGFAGECDRSRWDRTRHSEHRLYI